MYLWSMRSPRGGELSLSACPGWGIDRQVRTKLQIPGGMPRGGMVTGRIEPCITRTNEKQAKEYTHKNRHSSQYTI